LGSISPKLISARPWGAFFRLDDNNAEKFIDKYFSDIKEQFATFEGLSPKYLLVEPGKQLSWQYHYRRAEHWRVLEGSVGVKLSDDDTLPNEITILNEGDLIQFTKEKRHRLIGLDDWGVVVEIWEHTEKDSPSNEQDIVRVEDDFGR
jgi:mannose-6-phosphate isomerase